MCSCLKALRFAVSVPVLLVALGGPLALGGERYAVVIGINDYESMGKLSTCRADAKAMAQVLVDRAGFEKDFVILMTDDAQQAKDRPTLGRMGQRIEQVCQLAQPGDTVLVFFSGHGVTVGEKGYLVPVDGNATNAVPLEKVKDHLGSSKAGTRVLILDACHAGMGVRGVGGIAGDLARTVNFVMLLSCAPEQQSYEEEGHGVFTRRLLDGLAGAADADSDKAITQNELFDYVRAQMARWSLKSTKTQTPVIFGDTKTRLALARVASAAPYVEKPTLKVYREWPFTAAEAKRRQRETAEALGVKLEEDVDLGNGVKLTLVLIPAGQFTIGSPKDEAQRDNDEDQKQVTISKPFWLGKHEVTQEQWEAVMGANPSHFKGAKNPVESVSWNDIQGFLQKLNAGRGAAGFSLPTEAQWEYACRAGTTTPFHFGETISTDQANYDGNFTYGNGQKGEYREKTIAVGTFAANAWGLYDVHGNVYEWCSSPYATEYDGSEQKGADAQGEHRVLRGGSWLSYPWACRSAPRLRLTPDARSSLIGFRVVRLAAGP